VKYPNALRGAFTPTRMKKKFIFLVNFVSFFFLVGVIPKKYEKYYDIQEYDGLESVAIDYYRYNADNFMNGIKKILKSEMNNDEKIKEIECLVLNTKNM